jgi:predicted SprT family Zn-dependent metalloprotease
MFTRNEAQQYCRMTLKQWKLPHVSIIWKSNVKSFWGLARISRKEIILNDKILQDFRLFDEVLKHEIAHFLQYQRNGFRFFRKNGRWQLHGADFRAVCREMNIPARSRIPVPRRISLTSTP